MSDEQARIEAEPCRCVTCSSCCGLGTIRVSYDGAGRTCEPYGDDLDDLEMCEECHGGIVEVCDRCRLLEEMDQEQL